MNLFQNHPFFCCKAISIYIHLMMANLSYKKGIRKNLYITSSYATNKKELRFEIHRTGVTNLT